MDSSQFDIPTLWDVTITKLRTSVVYSKLVIVNTPQAGQYGVYNAGVHYTPDCPAWGVFVSYKPLICSSACMNLNWFSFVHP